MEHDSAKHQNGWPHICSQRSVEEKLQLATVGDGDKHLVEFSDALRSKQSNPILDCVLCF